MQRTWILMAPLVFALFPPQASASTDFPFALDLPGDASLMGGALALYGSSLYFQTIKPAPNAGAIDSANIPFLDRAYPATPSSSLYSAGDDLSIALAALPLALAIGRSSGEMLDLGAMYVESLGLAYGLDSLLKSTIVRYRPYAYSTTVQPDFTVADIASSFPSANSSLAFVAASFGGFAYGRLYPDSSLRPWVWVAGLGLASGVSALLVAGGDHFLSDAVAGAAIGAASGILVPLLHERFRAAKLKRGAAASSLELEAGPGGLVALLRLGG